MFKTTPTVIRNLSILGLVLGLAAVPQVARAQTNALVEFEFDETGKVTGFPATDRTSPDFLTNGLTTTAFQLMTVNDEGGGGNDAGLTATGYGQAFIREEATGATQAAALADNDYFAFTLTADSGKFLDLDTIQLNLSLVTGGTVYVLVNNSLIGTASPTPNTFAGTGAGVDDAFNVSIDLSSVANTNAAAFQIRISDGADGSTAVNRLERLVVTGAVIPEPSALTLVGMGLLGLAVLRRRRR